MSQTNYHSSKSWLLWKLHELTSDKHPSHLQSLLRTYHALCLLAICLLASSNPLLLLLERKRSENEPHLVVLSFVVRW
jgi:hypothetical protein